MHIFNETFTNVFLLDSSPSINSASYTHFVIRRVNFKIHKTDDTHLEAHLTNYSLLKKNVAFT